MKEEKMLEIARYVNSLLYVSDDKKYLNDAIYVCEMLDTISDVIKGQYYEAWGIDIDKLIEYTFYSTCDDDLDYAKLHDELIDDNGPAWDELDEATKEDAKKMIKKYIERHENERKNRKQTSISRTS